MPPNAADAVALTQYDASGDPSEISSHDASGGFDTYDQSFDAAGELTGQSPVAGSGGVSSSDTYDSLGALSSTTAGSSTTSYSYDQLGETTGVSTDPLSGESTSYDAAGLESAVSGWAPPQDVDGPHSISSISCPTTTFCAAGDDAGDVLTWNGTAWSAPFDLDGSHTVEGISCPSAGFCALRVQNWRGAGHYSRAPARSQTRKRLPREQRLSEDLKRSQT